MKTTLLLAALLALGTARPALAQGSLTPPGPPAPVMKSLDQIEPRTIISALPFTISQPGSYALAGNLQFTAASGHAISITASHVKLDLQGFTLSSTAAVTGDGINVAAAATSVSIVNGTITGTTVVAVTILPSLAWNVTSSGGFGMGVNAQSTTGMRLRDLTVTGCRTSCLRTGWYAIVEGCATSESGSDTTTAGLHVGDFSTVTRCTCNDHYAAGLYAERCTVTDCTATYNFTKGFHVLSSTVSRCMANFNNTEGINVGQGSMSECTARNNKGIGLVTDEGIISHCTARNNTGVGIFASSGVVCFSSSKSNTGGNSNTAGATLTGNNF